MTIRFFRVLALIAGAIFIVFRSSAADPATVEFLESVSVTVLAEGASGSGTVIVRMNTAGVPVAFVLTAGHVVERLKSSGSSYRTAEVLRLIEAGGRTVGNTRTVADVVRCSGPSDGDDLALLRIWASCDSTNSAVFYNAVQPPKTGTSLIHVGSPGGIDGANSVTFGRLAKVGRVFDGRVFDQTTCTVMPGCSGGGVFLENGELIGVLVLMRHPTDNYVVPVRRVRAWAAKEGVSWVLDPSLPVPATFFD